MFWNRRAARIAVGLLLLALGVTLLLPRLTGYTSRDGTVNARFVVVSSPIQGVVLQTPSRVGTRVPEGETLLEVRNDRFSIGGAQDLQGELESLWRRAEVVRDQRSALEALRTDLEARLASYHAASARNLEQTIAIQRDRMGIAEARIAETQAALTRALQLRSRELTTEMDLERSRAANLAARREADASRSELQRLEQHLVAARGGVFVGEGRNDVPYSRQRLDEVLINLAELSARQRDLEAQAQRINQRLAIDDQQRRTFSEAVVSAPITGVIWRNNVVEGSNVVVGSELMRVLDCRVLFVDILLSEGDYDEFSPGTEAQVRLYGASQILRGQVESVRGSAASTEEPTLAARPPEGTGRLARVRVRLSPSDLSRDYPNFCQVGRTAQVRFRTSGLPVPTWVRGLWFSLF
jgi:multidrug resistance efflux pump